MSGFTDYQKHCVSWVAMVVAALLIALPAPRRAAAQVLYGSIVGTVQDNTGGVVPSAAVSIINKGTGQTQETVTSPTGMYTLSNVLAGIYDLSITAEGFRTYTEENIAITFNAVRRTDVTLQLGQVTETVTVEAAALTLQTDKTDVSAVLEASVVTNMPLPNYRNYQSLINLVPGATPARFQNSVGSSPERALTSNVNGVNRNNNLTKVDGAASVFIWLPHHAQYINPAETVEAVNISTNNFDAEQGMAGGAAITVVTKSGTNEFHGSAFAFNDNQRIRAKNFFSPGEKPRSTKNIDGFTLGGPIVRNTLFFFGGWEGYRERLGFERTGMTVATADQRAGDFSAFDTTIFDPVSGNLDGTGRVAFANSVIPLSRQSSITRQMQALVPLPNKPGAVANLARAGTQALDRDNFDFKINWNKSDTLSIWGKYSIMDAEFSCAPALDEAQGPGLCNGASGRNVTVDQTSTIGFTKTFSANFLWDGTFGWTRHGNNSGDFTGFGTNFGLDVLGIPGTNGPDPRQSGIPRFSISGYENLGNPSGWQPNFYGDTTFTINQNFSWIKGAHNFRFGFEGMRHHMNHWQPEIGSGPRGRFTFDRGVTGLNGGPSLNQFNAYGGFLLGLPSTVGKSLQFEKMGIFNPQAAWYVRDRWQVSSKLTLNLGLRYSLYPMMTRPGRGGIERWDTATNLICLGGAGDNPKDCGVSTSKKMFAPRIGIAYRLNDKVVIRTGYGIVYNPMPLARPLRGWFPLTIAQDFPGPNPFQPFRPIEQGIPELTVPAPGAADVPLPPTADNRSINSDELHRGYVQSWNLIIEAELPGQFVGSIGYVGTQTTRSFADLNINTAQPGTGQAGKPFFDVNGRTATTRSWNGFLSSNYHSLQMTLNRRVAANLTVKGAYTYSKAIGMTDDDGWAGVRWNITDQFPRNRASTGFDQNHIFQMGYVYKLPFGKGQKFANTGAARWLLGDWQINGVTAMFQGRRFDVGSSGASLNAPGNGQTADQIKPEVEKIGGVGPGQVFFDPGAFAPVNDVRFGTSGRNILQAPGVVNFDFSAFRTFPITEKLNIEFRAEAFNLTNTPHFDRPRNNASSSRLFEVTSAQQDQRQFRFGLRLEW